MVPQKTALSESPLATKSVRWRALIVDDHQLFRNGLRELLEDEPDVEVCAEAAEISEALAAFEREKPNLVTIDISLTDGNGLSLVERIKRQSPAITILVLSMYDEGIYADRAIAAGASGYVCKQSTNEEIRRALRTVLKGEVYLSPAVMQRLLLRKSPQVGGGQLFHEARLSNRELEILTLIGQGSTTQGIATKLHLSVSTIETYRERLKTKLQLANGAELTRHAILWLMSHA